MLFGRIIMNFKFFIIVMNFLFVNPYIQSTDGTNGYIIKEGGNESGAL